jgi:hypothetical protein
MHIELSKHDASVVKQCMDLTVATGLAPEVHGFDSAWNWRDPIKSVREMLCYARGSVCN